MPKRKGSDMTRIRGTEERFGIGRAVKMLQQGLRVYREGWNGKGQYLELQIPNHHSRMSLPYVFIRTVQGDLVPWLASQTDLLARDWCAVVQSRHDACKMPGLPQTTARDSETDLAAK